MIDEDFVLIRFPQFDQHEVSISPSNASSISDLTDFLTNPTSSIPSFPGSSHIFSVPPSSLKFISAQKLLVNEDSVPKRLTCVLHPPPEGVPFARFTFSIDRGGTFTDVYAETPEGPCVEKLLSVDPEHYKDAATEGIRRVVKRTMGCDYREVHLATVRMGTTIATNALLERKGEPAILIITKGFRDALHIAHQQRPNLFDLTCRRPQSIYERVVEVDERVRVVPERHGHRIYYGEDGSVSPSHQLIESLGVHLTVEKKPDLDKLRDDLRKVLWPDGSEKESSPKYNSASVVLLHAYAYGEHEKMVGKMLREEFGIENITLSHETVAMVRLVPRGQTTCVDAYLTPLIKQYVENFKKGGFEETNVSFMQSDGGLTPMDRFKGSRAIFSGPAGGVVGYAKTTFLKDVDGKADKRAVIGFDMGGTSTDVSRFHGQFEHVWDVETAGVQIQLPQLDIRTVAAGGGSRLFFQSGMFIVGPESSGAEPGPCCYRKGGYLAITDANVVLGHICPEFFPRIFGHNGDESLDVEASFRAMETVTNDVNTFFEQNGQSRRMTVEQVAMGFIKVANETMCRPIREMTVSKGFHTKSHVLSCFGGAGPQHACSIARNLGIRTVFVPRYAGILSAFGLGMASIVQERQEPCSFIYSVDSLREVEETLIRLKGLVVEDLKKDGFDESRIRIEMFLNMRYKGSDFCLMTMKRSQESFIDSFTRAYKREYGFCFEGRDVVIDDIRVRGYGDTIPLSRTNIKPWDGSVREPIQKTFAWFDDEKLETSVYEYDELDAGERIDGPAIVVHESSQIIIEPHWTATITEVGDMRIDATEKVRKETFSDDDAEGFDSVAVSIFGHRFMSIAEQMGRSLQRTSISTNIKERLDFSCAIFGPDGGLVSNAPHIPVHLGSMSEAVRWQMENTKDAWKIGDVIVTNHPNAGGTHLPDITVITPVFSGDSKEPVFFVASRGHHADIGGISPGSMPPFSKHIDEEGASIRSFKLVEGGVFNTDGIMKLLHGTRTMEDNIADLQAQVAANQKGISLVQELIAEYGLDVVMKYMKYVQDVAELSVREMLTSLVAENREIMKKVDDGKYVVEAEDFMDDGTKIALTLTINEHDGSAEFDFSKSGDQVSGNWNAPRAITHSAVLYCLRSLVKRDIPLNQGCLNPINIIIRNGSILDPLEGAAVVGGNVLTSQRITDVVLKAFGAAAGSQGCMNNFTFGDKTFGYYETIAGGAGAGASWDGESGVHTHMTNTRITDPEIMEKRYPVLVRQFSLRKGSGGDGKFKGGEGVIRDIEFLVPLSVGILSERRVFAPYGLFGGCDGGKGRNTLRKASGELVEISGKHAFDVDAGDRFVVETPGGGGFGKK
uniref:5-oxoprolinase n=1 Tax=Stygiella incarcerata TaxID=1712417 RepID=A0A192ZIK8_9EUKA|nr:5-oxoprolinase [Stygiella incarcerata]